MQVPSVNNPTIENPSLGTRTQGNYWYQALSIGNYGVVKDGFGNYLKPDWNFECAKGTIIFSIGDGIVSGVVHNPAYAPGTFSVTVKLTTPINEIATHEAYNFLESASVSIGDKASVGTTLGIASNKYGFGVAFALTNDDEYGDGTFLKYNGDMRLDPAPVIDAVLANQPQPTGGSTSSSLFSGLSSPVVIGVGLIALVLIGIVLFVGLSAV
jgi:hypothetical protein